MTTAKGIQMKPVLFIKSHIDTYTRQDGAVVAAHDDKRTAAAAPAPGQPKKHKIEVIQGTMAEAGGYSVNGKHYVGDDHESLVDEAKEMAYRTGRSVEDAIHHIMPQEHLDEADGKTMAKSVLFVRA